MGSQAKIKVITSDKAYQATMEKIDGLMKIGEAKLKPAQAAELRLLALAAQAYEKSMYTIPAPKTLQGLIEFKMYERKLKQKELAQLLDIAESKLSQILTGKRKPDVSFLKAAHEQLEIDGNILLEYA
ncbi:MAG: helix-turn-helix domain-containing protein [Sphingobacteriales bacterium]